MDDATRAVVLLGGEAGLRAGEIVALEWTDLDRVRKVIVVQRSEWRGVVGTTKNGRSRRVPMTARLAAALDKLRHLRGPRVFYRQDDTPTTVTRRILGRWVRQAERRAGLPVTGRLHVLRHTFCSHLAMRGVPVKVIQELAGHADLQTTLRYMHLAQGSLETGIRALDNRTQVERHEAGSGGGTAH